MSPRDGLLPNAHVDEEIAHDVNNLLGVILNHVTLVRRGLADPQALTDLDEIRMAAERAALLIRRLVTLVDAPASAPEALDA